jgi:hypothetical protein
VPVAIVVLVLMASLGWFQRRLPGLVSVFVVMGLGLLGIALATLLLERGLLAGDHWMILVGMGTYLAYVPFSSFLFDRIMAARRIAGTAVFLVTLSDAVGYTGSVALQLYKDLGRGDVTRLDFFISVSYVLGIVGFATLALAAAYFVRLALHADARGA